MVDLGERSYPIAIGAGTLPRLGARVRELGLGKRIAVVTNTTVARHYREVVSRSLADAGFTVTVLEVPDGEEHKNLAWLTFLYDRLVDARLDRGCAIVALGGGVIGDLAGFTAATFQRGVPVVQVPTTLLAQVDSSVGGKTAINHPGGKNLIGAFHQPRLVWIDVHTLRTLPRREMRAGLAEVIKHGAILGPELFDLLERRLEDVLAFDEALCVEVVRQNCAIKSAVVAEDERESGYRAVLNFGHTIAHAIEMLTDYRGFLHGEAVAIGMAFAARLSVARKICDREVADRIVALLKRAGLPTEIPAELVGPNMVLAVEADKKVASGKVKFVVIEEIGRVRLEMLSGQEVLAYAKRA
ncbi:MAG: 3-dehydroquinate synthase [Candidatus Binatia bacterium]